MVDWNAWVGSIGGDGLWDGALGSHGVDVMNEAGSSLCVLNELSVTNTMFEEGHVQVHMAAPRHQNKALYQSHLDEAGPEEEVSGCPRDERCRVLYSC